MFTGGSLIVAAIAIGTVGSAVGDYRPGHGGGAVLGLSAGTIAFAGLTLFVAGVVIRVKAADHQRELAVVARAGSLELRASF